MTLFFARSNKILKPLLIVLAMLSAPTFADNADAKSLLIVPMSQVSSQGIGAIIGDITLEQTPYGILFTPHLRGLTPGLHGFHVHMKASCEPATLDGKVVAALGAGGHFDPENTGKHLGPYGPGHLGDLPALYVDDKGHANYPVLAPRVISLDLLRGHTLMIHERADNHSDHPKPLGGGGARMQCGVISAS